MLTTIATYVGRRAVHPIFAFALAAVFATCLCSNQSLASVTPKGSYSSSIPIDAPRFKSIDPQFSLEYDSQTGNGPIGVGWQLRGLSEIHVTSSTGGIQTGLSSDKYWLDGNELIACPIRFSVVRVVAHIAASPSCKYRLPAPWRAYSMRMETFERIAFNPTAPGGQWRLWRKDGTTVTYEHESSVVQWHISDLVDVSGNSVHYAYKQPVIGPSLDYLDTVTYNQTRIQFYWEGRADVLAFVGVGEMAYTGKRLKSIDIQVEGQRQRAYALTYKQSAGTGRTELVNISHYGNSASLDADGNVSGTSLPPATLTYDDQRKPENFAVSAALNVALPALPLRALDPQYQYDSLTVANGANRQFLVGDFDGDGRTDAVMLEVREDPSVVNSNSSRPQTAMLDTHVRLANQRWVNGTIPFPAAGSWDWDLPQFARASLLRAWVGDVNGDGFDDLILMTWAPVDPQSPEGALQLQLNVAISNGDGTFVLQQPQFVSTPWIVLDVDGAPSPPNPPDFPVCTTGDFDGDGRTDFACLFEISAGGQRLGIAYSKASGGFSIAAQPIVIADDPLAVIPGSNGLALPYETRRLAAGDVNNDGLTDLVILDLNPSDVAACASVPADQRDTCTIKYDLLTLLSKGDAGDGFSVERTPTPWLRTEFFRSIPGSSTESVSTVPASLTLADLNGDGRADVLLLTGPSQGTSFQSLGIVRSAIRGADGSYQLSETALPSLLSSIAVEFSLGDVNGDGRTDLIVAAPIMPGDGINCSAAQFRRPVFTTLRAKPDGSFDFPNRWDDCAVSQEETHPWAAWTPAIGITMLHVGDTNGDGLADVIVPVIPAFDPQNGTEVIAVYDRVAQPDAATSHRWIATDLNGDGKTDFVALVRETNSIAALTLIAQPDGSYKSGQYDLGIFENSAQRTWRIADVNGDGRADIVHVQCVDTTVHHACDLVLKSFLSRGDGTFTSEPVTLPLKATNALPASLMAIRVADVNFDRRADLVQVVTTTASAGASRLGIRTLLSDGGGWQQQALQPIPIPSVPSGLQALLSNAAAWRVGNFDGDGRAELVHIISDTASARLTRVAFGSPGWTARSDGVAFPQPPGGWLNYTGRHSYWRWRVADVNGDGVSDLVRLIGSDTSFLAQRLTSLAPSGWSAAIDALSMPSDPVLSKSFADDSWISADINGDGIADFLFIDASGGTLAATALYGSGLGYGRLEQVMPTGSQVFSPRPTQQLGESSGKGDATVDYVESSGPNTVSVHALLLGEVPDVLVAHASGGTTTNVGYSAAGQFIDPSASSGCTLPLGQVLRVVAETSVQDGHTSTADKATYGYGCPYWSQYHRALIGWSESVGSKSAGVNRPAFDAHSFFQNSDECLGQLSYQGVTGSTGEWIGQRSIIAYLPPGLSPPYQCLTNYIQTVTTGNFGTSAIAMNEQTYFRYDAFGNVTAETEDDLNGLTRGTFRNFKHATVPYIVNAVGSEDRRNGTDSSGSLLRSKLYCYDGDTSFTCSGTPTKGQLTSTIEIWEQGTRVTNLFYDTVGNLAGIRDANGNGVEYFFDPVQRRFPTIFVDSLGTTQTVDWDRTLGLVKTITDQNGGTTTFDYDEFGRLKKIVSPVGGVLHRNYIAWGDPNHQYIEDTLDDGSASGLWSRQYLDGLGRPYLMQRKSDVAADTLSQEIDYTDSGPEVYRTSYSRVIGRFRPLPIRRFTTYAYDEVGRLTRLEQPDGSAEQFQIYADGHNRLTSTIIDAVGTHSQVDTDAFNRPVESRAFDGSMTLATRMEFDGADQLSSITDAEGNKTTYTWDMLGRNTSVTDPDLGLRTRGFDLVGNVASVTDAKNRTITYQYDQRNRRILKTYPTGQSVTWNYDETSVTNGNGRLTSFTDLTATNCGPGPNATINYDEAGKPTNVARCIDGRHGVIAMDYDLLGRLRHTTYPDGEVVESQYGDSGQLSAVLGIATITDRDERGRATGISYGNGVTRQLTLSPTREWLLKLRDTLGAQPIFDASYNYDASGKLSTESSTSNATKLAFFYDGAERLTGVGGSQQQAWQYSLSGNLMTNSALGYYAYPAPGPTACNYPTGPAACKQPHGAQGAGRFSLKYDDNGLLSMMTDTATGAIRSMDWTDDHSPSVMLDFDGAQTQYEYDAFGNRVLERRANETITHFGPLSRHSSLTGVSNIYYAGARAIGSKTLGNRIWWHTDRSGTVRAESDAYGNVLARYNYSPYGEPRPVGNHAPSVSRFGGADFDKGSELIWMGARFYDPLISRFVSADSIVPDALNTQGPNRYALDYNNPARYVDPSGHQPTGISSGPGGSPDVAADFDFASSSIPGAFTFGLTLYGVPTPTLNPGANPSGTGGEDYAAAREVRDKAVGLGVDIWIHLGELGFGAVTGGLQAAVPTAWALPGEKAPELLGLNFDFGQQNYFDLGRSAVLTAGGAFKAMSGLATMAAAAPPTLGGAVTSETGVGAVVMVGGAAIELEGLIIAADGAADVYVGGVVVLKSGIYILRDRLGIIRYGGKAANFNDRKYKHEQSKPQHRFKDLWDIDDEDTRRGGEQWLLEHCPTCDWNKISGMSSGNKSFDERVIKFLEWHLKKYGYMPAELFK